ncbi:MAG TPA: DUF362 domain-containing protein [Acholeplasmataceae bacterium]|nr:DUF362 domain-containing protein [Acholeplasmataceae bacterium]
MKTTKVALINCFNYELEELKTKIKDALDLIGGLETIPQNARVLIKPNCLGPFHYSQAITTHPVFVQAVIQIVKTRTNNIIVGDNPATKNLIYTLKKNGIYDVIENEKVEILKGDIFTTIYNEEGKIYHEFEVSKQMIDVDIMINLPKLKTHALMYLTCAQKNLFGLIYGLNKASWHVKAPNPLVFAEAFNDFYGAILNSYQNKKIINICDGIIGLEGEGPSTSGFPKEAGAILASFDAISLDRVAIEIAGLEYDKYVLNQIGSKRGLGVGNLKDIEIVGEKINTFENIKFVPATNPLSIRSLRLLKFKRLRNLVLEHPVIDKQKCIKCGECAKICPPKALTIKKGSYPKLNKTSCIRCWCCSEVCPQNAINKSERPLLGKILLKN